MSILSVIEQFNKEVNDKVTNLPSIPSEQLGLDYRCGAVRVDLEAGLIIAGRSNYSSLEYYGGFEYVEPESIVITEHFRIYLKEDSRVREALEYYVDHNLRKADTKLFDMVEVTQ